MPDPNAPAIGGNAGQLAAPAAPAPVGTDLSSMSTQLDTDVGNIESQFDPKIAAEEQTAEGYESKAVAAGDQAADEAQKAAGDDTAQEEEMKQWLTTMPSRQASYQASMSSAPMLALLIGLGGKVTKLNGQQMLAATNGMVQGLNASSEEQYQEAYQKWKDAFAAAKAHQAELMKMHNLMLESFRGRADAYQRAADAARRMTGDLLDDKQRQIAERTNLFKAQTQAMTNLERVNTAREQLHEKVLKDIAQENHWKEVEKHTQAADPATKQLVAAEHSRWTNAKSQIDENMKRRGQINANLSMSDEQKQAAIDKIDAEDEALRMEMNKSQSNVDAILAGAAAAKPGAAPGAPAAGGAAPGVGRSGVIDRGGSNPGAGVPQPPNKQPDLPPAAMQRLQAKKGQPVTFTNGQTWIMDTNGNVSRVQ